jgi:hypothetical protein
MTFHPPDQNSGFWAFWKFLTVFNMKKIKTNSLWDNFFRVTLWLISFLQCVKRLRISFIFIYLNLQKNTLRGAFFFEFEQYCFLVDQIFGTKTNFFLTGHILSPIHLKC